MNNRDKRKNLAEDTLQALEQGFYTTSSGKRIDLTAIQQRAEQGTKVYSPKLSDDLINQSIPELEENTQIEVNNLTTLDATRQLIAAGFTEVLCLNFASAKNAGGGFLGGSQAQEESIARATGLYKCLLRADEYYETNRNTKSCFYTDYMIYSPSVPILKNEKGNYLEELVTCAIITAPAVNTGVVKQREAHRLDEVELVMKRRIKKVLAIALANGHRSIVLGAWGCGVFQNDPNAIAQYFKEVIDTDFHTHFKKIVFAIYSKNERFINAFQKSFNNS